MFIVLGIMFCGVAAGFLMRRHMWVKTGVTRLLIPVVYLLLFVMGVTVGANPNVMENLSTLGFEALVITIGALGGSLILARIVWKYIFKSRITNEK